MRVVLQISATQGDTEQPPDLVVSGESSNGARDAAPYCDEGSRG